MHPEDQRLLQRLRAHEPAASAIVEAWLRSAARPYRARLGDDWHDALQDVRLEIWRLLDGNAFRGEARLRRYIFRVTNHTMIDRLRQRARAGTFWRQGEHDAVESLVDGRVGADRRSADRALLLHVLSQVSEECRRLWRALVAGQSYDEMSREFGVRAGTLRVRVLRCRRRADDLLDSHLNDSARGRQVHTTATRTRSPATGPVDFDPKPGVTPRARPAPRPPRSRDHQALPAKRN